MRRGRLDLILFSSLLEQYLEQGGYETADGTYYARDVLMRTSSTSGIPYWEIVSHYGIRENAKVNKLDFVDTVLGIWEEHGLDECIDRDSLLVILAPEPGYDDVARTCLEKVKSRSGLYVGF